jgi:hypothetical protein
MTKYPVLLVFNLALLALAGGCQETRPAAIDAAVSAGPCAPSDPDSYPSERYLDNALIELGLRAAHDAFMLPMRAAGADVAMKPTAMQLRALYQAGPPSVKSITTPAFAAQVEEWLALFEASAGQPWMPADPPPATGGKLGTDIFSRDGLDIRQAIDKGLFAAAFYNHAATLMGGAVTPATIDRILAIFGSHPSFSTGDGGAATADVWSAVYARRRTDPRAPSPGIYLRIKRNLIAARAAAAAGGACATELQGALRAVREDWEQALLATTLFYASDARTKLGQANAAAALHSLGEGLGFAYGFRMMPVDRRRISDGQIDEILALLGIPPGGPVTLYKFATDTTAQVSRLDGAITKIQAVYGFSDAEVASFQIAY